MNRCHSFRTLWAAAALIVFVLPVHGQTNNPFGLDFSGDFRLRYERTTRQEPDGRTQALSNPANKEVVRFRVGFKKSVNGLFLFGARFGTGSPDNPKTTDITLGEFVNDLTVSLDRVYLEMKYKNLFLTGGKFPNPLLSTEIMWDADVNPQGVAASFAVPGLGPVAPKIIGIYSVVDEQTIYPDSDMRGGQMQLSIRPSTNLGLTLAGAYYNYRVKSLVNAGSGDIRTNYLNASKTAYLSDYDLVDAIAVLEYRGFGNPYTLRLVGDYIKNIGANVREDTGFSVDCYLGQVAKKNDLRFLYGYSMVETDAVLAAFSHDNTTIPTNYEQHSLAVDYVVVENTILNLTMYVYRKHDFETATSAALANKYFTRLRLNVVVMF